MSTNPLSPFLSRSGVNLAPIEPIQQLRQTGKVQATKLTEAVRELYWHKFNEHKAAFEERISMGHLVALFMKGEHLLRKRLYAPGYYVQPVPDGAMRQTSIDLTAFYGHTCCTKMISSNPNVIVKAGDESAQSIAAAQNARPLIDYWEGQWYTTRFNWREALHALQDGWYGHRIDWDMFAEGPVGQKLATEDYQVEDPGAGQCWDCQFSGTGKDFQPADNFAPDACPNCGSHAVTVQRAQAQQLQRIVPGERKQYGAPKISSFPFAAARWDMAVDMELSSWAIIRQKIQPGVVKLLLGDAVLPDTQSSDDKSLDVIDALAYSGQPFEGASNVESINRTNDRRTTFSEFWASPEDYAHIELEPCRTVDGIELPGGKMGRIFNGPVCFTSLNDVSLITGIYPESHRDKIVTGQWFLESDSGAGRGIQNTVAVQKRHNKFDGLIDKGLSSLAVPAVFMDKNMLTEDQGRYVMTPENNVWVNLQNLPPNRGLQDAIFIPRPGDISGQAINYGQVFLRQMFQLSSLVVEFTEGILPVDNRTATGAQITANLANSLFGPMLLVKAETRARIAEILVMLHVKHCPVPRYFPGKEGRPGQSVSGQSLKGVLIYEIAQGSQVPVTPFSQQADVKGVIEAFQGVEGLLALMDAKPAVFAQLTKPFNVKFETHDQDTVSTLCFERLEQMRANLQSGVREPDILIQSLRPPIAIEEPKHDESKRFWQDWLITKDGQSAPQILRDTAAKLYWLHSNYAMQQSLPQAANRGMVAGVEQAAIQAPTALGQQALQPPDNSAEVEQQEAAQQRGADMLTEASWQEHESEQKDKELASQERVAQMNAEAKAKQARQARKAKTA